jgi:integrase
VEAATARARQLALRRFSAWCADEGEIDYDDLLGLKPPKLDQKVVERLTEEQIRALVKACSGTDFRDRRDEAIVRFMLEAIVRAGEVVAMTTADVDIGRGIALVRRGKGGKGRPVPFARRPAGRSTATCGSDAATAWRQIRRCGWATGARACRTTGSTALSSTAPSWQASRTSTRTSPDTPPLSGGCRPRGRRVA